MTSAEVKDLVQSEIGNDWGISTSHGVVLQECLIEPELRHFLPPAEDGEEIELWVVLEEDPKGRLGYKIVFDQKRKVFGLATTDLNGPDVYLGPYGTLMETLEAM